jgi:hypothetical protein
MDILLPVTFYSEYLFGIIYHDTISVQDNSIHKKIDHQDLVDFSVALKPEESY